MYTRLKSFIDKNDMFFKSQYGFRKDYRIQHGILGILNKIQTNMDEKVYSSGIFYDLRRPLTWWIIMYSYVMFLN